MSRANNQAGDENNRSWWIATWTRERWLKLGLCAAAVAVMIACDSELRALYRSLVPDEPELRWVADALTDALDPWLVLIMVCVACVAAWHRWGQMAKALCVGIAVQAISIAVLKDLLGRARPGKTDGVSIFYGPQFGSHSMPSGHAGLAFLLATVLSGFFPRGRWLFYPLAAIIAIARVHLDRHFFSDAFAGAAFGILVGQWVLWRFRRAPQQAAAPESDAARAEAPVEPVSPP